jgi:hypothetical protein
MPPTRRNPFSEAGRAGLLKRMERDKCKTFSDKVRWVETHMPSIDNPAAFVGALVRGEVQNPSEDYHTARGEAELLLAEDRYRTAQNLRQRGDAIGSHDQLLHAHRMAALAEADLLDGGSPKAEKAKELTWWKTYAELDEEHHGKRNPVDASYTEPLGEGAFSKAFGKRDEQATFYQGLDRSPRGVETISMRESDRYPFMKGARTDIDVSKILLILAREKLKGNKKAQAFLPAIEPVRIDYSKPNKPEIIYAMPVYRTLGEHGVTLSAPNKLLYRALASAAGIRAPVDECIADLLKNQARVFATVKEQIKLIADALQAIEDAAESVPFEVKDFVMDIHEGNVAIDASGHLILLDPVVAMGDLSEVEEFWQQHGWPGTGKPLPRKAKR